MSKSDPIEKALNRVGELRHQAPSRTTTDEIRQFLGHRSNLVAAKAAKLAAELRGTELIPDLVASFQRFMSNPTQTDRRCAAVTEIVKTLYEFDYVEPDIYLSGLHHVQLEGSFGPPVDTAATLRGTSAQGLLRTGYPDAMVEVLPLLVDPEPAARIGAVRAFTVNGGSAGVLVLRLKALTGDPEPEVLVECFCGLLSAAPEHSINFVSAYMEADDSSTSDAAIWALGQSRLKSGFDRLREKWDRTAARSMRKTLLGAMAASRIEEANQFLYSMIAAGENGSDAGDAFEALSAYKSPDSITRAIQEMSRTCRAESH